MARLQRLISVLTVAACVMTLVATLFHAVAFSTPAWLTSDGTSPFNRIGFHEACFTMCRDPLCPAYGDEEVYYDGCFWIDDWYFREIKYWLFPSWFEELRNLAIANIPIITISFVVLLLATCLAFAERFTVESHHCRDVTLQTLLYIGAAVCLSGAIINMLILIQFYMHGFVIGWMPMPEKNSYGYSFYLDLITTILLSLSFLASVFAAIFKTIALKDDKDPLYSDDMMLGRGR